MNPITPSSKFMRQRRFYTCLPAIVLPISCLVFWLVVGSEAPAQKPTGLNLRLPDAVPKKDDPVSKLGFYEAADADSARKAQAIRGDAYFQPARETTIVTGNQQMPPTRRVPPRTPKEIITKAPVEVTAEPEKKEPDPDLEQLNQMLDKIREIQRPVAAKEKPEKKEAVTMSARLLGTGGDNTFFGGAERSGAKQLFYSESTSGPGTSVPAIIEEAQKLQQGSVVKMRTLENFYVQAFCIPAGSLVYGVVSIVNERLRIKVSTVRKDNQLVHVSLSVYDMDGLEGIYAPGSVSRDAAKESAGDGLQSVGWVGTDLSIKGQLMNSGLGTVKNLFSRKVRQVSVLVHPGYKVLLHEPDPENEN